MKFDEIKQELEANFKVVYEMTPFSKINVISALSREGFELKQVTFDINDFKAYLTDSESSYSESYRTNFGSYFERKALEHFVSFQLVNLERSDKYMDIASSSSEVQKS